MCCLVLFAWSDNAFGLMCFWEYMRDGRLYDRKHERLVILSYVSCYTMQW